MEDENNRAAYEADEKENKSIAQRIIYIEPNDNFGSVDGVPLTPDYTDFCISFDLVVEVVSRLRANSATIDRPVGDSSNEPDGKKTYVISWSSKYGKNEDTAPVYVSFMGGESYGENETSYLTTYYVDNQYNDYKEKSIVEGLGVETVSISFETFFAPMVKIRFIDVRGSSIFGREEVLHKDEVLTEDNIWGCFFTFPYPKYRLQVKGFYGKAVTYQLCCTDFRAHFNSQTGNYEIDMSFMGYDFGFLADLPMGYLMAAPYCGYGDTKAYWEKRRSSEKSWRMSDGNEISTLLDIRETIDSTIEKFSMDESEEVTQEEIEVEITDGERVAALDEMKTVCEEMFKFPGLNCDSVTKAKTTALGASMYSTIPSQNEKILMNVPKKEVKTENSSNLFSDTEKYREKLSALYISYVSKWTDSPISNLNPKFSSDNYTFGKLPFDAFFPDEFCNFYKALEKEYSFTTKKETQFIEKKAEPKTQITDNIYTLTHLMPTIGNLFLVLYCHLETFTHMVYDCAKRVFSQMEEGKRRVEDLGLPSTEYTDIQFSGKDKNSKNNQIGPFPAVYTYDYIDDENEESDTNTDHVKVDAWIREVVGDAPAWEEELLVEELYLAVMRALGESDVETPSFDPSSYPVLPSDLNHSTIPGIGVKYDVGDFAGYLGLRAASIFGIAKYSDTDAEAIGKMDAINYFGSGLQKGEIKDKIINPLESNGETITDRIFEIMLCDIGTNFNTYETKNHWPFEIVRNILSAGNNKHPIFKRKGGLLEYCYTTSGGNAPIAFVPSRLQKWSDISKKETVYTASDGVQTKFDLVLSSTNTTPKTYSSDVLHSIRSEFLLEKNVKVDGNGESDETERKRGYFNKEVFEVYYKGSGYNDGTDVSSTVTGIYDNLKNGVVSVNGYVGKEDKERFTSILKNAWKNVGDDDYNEFYYNDVYCIHPPLNVLGITTKSGDTEKLEEKVKGWSSSNYISDLTNKKITYQGGKFKYDSKEVSIDNCFTLPVLTCVHSGNVYKPNVFTSDIYYKQNSISDDTTRECTKALLFLLAITNGNQNKPVFINDRECGKIEGVPLSTILFYGGLYWRDRYIAQNEGKDCILFPDGYKKPVWKRNDGTILHEVPVYKYNAEGGMANGFILNSPNSVNAYSYLQIGNVIHYPVDFVIRNTLIDRFVSFVKDDWQTIRDSYEIYSSLEGYKKLTYNEFVEIAKNQEKAKGSDYDSKYMYSITDSGLGNFMFSIPFTYSGDEKHKAGIELSKKICLQKIIVQRTPSFGKDGAVRLSTETLKNYLNGFTTQLKEIANSEISNTSSSNTETDKYERELDMKRMIYMFLKNIWDRWLSGNSMAMYTSEHYMKNTLFIDSMYRNVYDKIHINCEILSDALHDVDGESMVMKFMSFITTKHNCMFFALPDYLNMGSEDEKLSEEAMSTLFTPMPYSGINKIEAFNKYIVMFTHQPSQINETSNGYVYDSFDIYSHDEDETKILSTFKKNALDGVPEGADEYKTMMTRYGYNMPAFGVAFGRQHNAIFKNVSIGMENPIQTEQSINATAMLADRGSNSGKKIIFYGQDLYSVYTGYSYSATVEMMGDAQIMPLMYFQLFNVPMFRGAYMIYNVTHTMKPGDMTTTFKAYKMSKRTLPWCKEWFSHYYFDRDGNVIGRIGDDECQTSGNCTYPNYHVDKDKLDMHMALAVKGATPPWKITHIASKDTKNKCEKLITNLQIKVHKSQSETATYNIMVNKNLIEEFTSIFEEIYNAKINVNGQERYLLITQPPHSFSYRPAKNGKPDPGLSNHSYGVAIDINANVNPMNECQKALSISKVDTETCIRTPNSPFVKIFAKHGFGWGGRYNDLMHFSYFDGR